MSKQLSRTCQSLAIFLVVLILGVSSHAWALSNSGGATPQEVFDRFKAATDPRNWEEMAACVSPAALTEMNSMMVFMGGMMIAFSQMGQGMTGGKGEVEQTESAGSEVSALEKKFETLLVHYGIDAKALEDGPGEEKALPDALHSPKFFADIMNFIDEFPSEEGEGPPGDTFPSPKGPLENVVIEGDRATATIAGEPGGFVRVDGRWYLDLVPEKDKGLGELEPAMEPEGEKGQK